MMRTNAMPAAVLRRGLLAGAAVTATLVLSACGGDGSSAGSGTGRGDMGSPAASTAAFNDTDVAFAQAMIPHHEQAVRMSALAGDRAADPAVRDLAGRIEAAQQPEITTMTGWLTAWGAPTGMPGMGTDHSGMPGMMSEAELGELTAAKGAAFDKRFLTLMISHHEGAITMARQETAQGSNAEAKALAARIVTDQQAEIATMRQMLADL